MAGPMESRILEKLQSAFSPSYLELENESHKHAVPPGSETHFKLVIVSEKVEGLSRVARSRLVHEVLAQELQSGVHALSLRTYAPDEWTGASYQTPPCAGAKKI